MPGTEEHTYNHNINTGNPFDVPRPHISEYTAAEIATLASRLEKQLGPEYISSRQGPGGSKVHYLSADKCINLANEVFGFNGWSSSLQSIQIDFVDETESGRVSLGLSVTLRVTLRDGTYHEDIGYGHIENCKGKAPAFEKAKKEGTTDALKRALRNFGNLLGNCVYDKEYVARVTKLKAGPTKWDPENLYRHPDFAPRKEIKNNAQKGGLAQMMRENYVEMDETCIGSHVEAGEDEFGSDDFDTVDFSVPGGDHPDEVVIAPNPASDHTRIANQKPARNSRSKSPHLKAPVARPNQPSVNWQREGEQAAPIEDTPVSSNVRSIPQATDVPSLRRSTPPEAVHDAPARFFTARAAEVLQTHAGPGDSLQASAFNPHHESPSIRKTAGIDHTKSKSICKDLVSLPPALSQVPNGIQDHRTIMQSEKARKIGMPMSTGSPMHNRGNYKVPQMKRPIGPMPSSALNDATTRSVDAEDRGPIVKKQKITSDTQGDDRNIAHV